MNRYEDQVVLITGGARGLGAAMAHRFAAEGAVVAIGDINEDSANSLAKQIQNEFHKDCLSHQVNVTSSISVDNWVMQVVGRHGRIDVLVNNAGVTRGQQNRGHQQR